MKILRLSLRNFLSFGEEPHAITPSSFTTVVGPNDAGKTNTFRAFQVIGTLLQDRNFDLRPYFFRGDLDRSLEISVGVQFDTQEVQALTDFLVSSTANGTLNVNPPERQRLQEMLESMSDGEWQQISASLFKSPAFEVRGHWQEANPLEPLVRIEADSHQFFIRRGGYIHATAQQFRSYGSISLVNLLLEELKGKDRALANFLSQNGLFSLIDRRLSQQGPWVVTVEGIQGSIFETNFGNRPEFRRFVRFMRERGFAGTYYDLYHVLGVIFNTSITQVGSHRFPGRADLDSLQTNEAMPERLNLGGEELCRVLFGLKNSTRPAGKRRFDAILTEFGLLTQGRGFDVSVEKELVPVEAPVELMSVPPGTGALTASREDVEFLAVRRKERREPRYSLTIQIRTDDFGVPAELAAAGLFETLTFLTALSSKEDTVLLLDEPALNLHPVAQRRLHSVFRKYVSQNRNQVIAITHSPYLVHARSLENIWRISRENGESVVRHVGDVIKSLEESEKSRVILRLGNPELKGLLFARGVIFVEGTLRQGCCGVCGPTSFELEQGR